MVLNSILESILVDIRGHLPVAGLDENKKESKQPTLMEQSQGLREMAGRANERAGEIKRLLLND